jgi:OmpA-OmpF porin, OOP family
VSNRATQRRLRHRGWFVLGLLCSWGAMAEPAADTAEDPQRTTPAEQPGRPDPSRTAEPAALSQLQLQLDGLSESNASCGQQYAANKAQAWINFSKYAAAEQLPREVQAAALGNGRALVAALAQHRPASHDTAELPHARRVRDDLWRGIAGVEQDGRVCAAPKMTAYCEVQLAWVDYESGAGGWRHADPYVRIAEDYCSTAMATAVPAPAEPAAPALLPPPLPPAAEPDPDVSVVFPHNRSARKDIRAPGHEELKVVAQHWKAGRHGKIHVTGHADLTGHTRYNLRLSARRARSVARELQSLGVPLGAIETNAVGSSQDVVACRRPGETAERRRYLACLEPNRRVVVHVDGP